MKAATLNELKKELLELPQQNVVELCLRLAKFKKESKELLTYLLFEAHDEQAYVQGVKQEIDSQFEYINTSTMYLAKKSLRKILRITNKYIKYSDSDQTAPELLIYFCLKLKASGIPVNKSTALSNLYEMQLKKINKYIDGLHEDYQYDFRREVETLR